MRKIIFMTALWVAVTGMYAQTTPAYQLSTHVLDISQGKPAQGIVISLYQYDFEGQEWVFVDKDQTGEDGRIADFLSADQDNYGAYKLRFETEPYFSGQSIPSIYPYIEVVFKIEDKNHYHIPITVSANGYSTYRGS